MNKITNYEDFMHEKKYRRNTVGKNEYLDTDLSKLLEISFIEQSEILNQINRFAEYEINEGLLSRVIGGLTGLALGKAVGKFLVKTFQIQEDTVLYKIFTSKLFYLAIGAAIGKGSPNKKHQRPK